MLKRPISSDGEISPRTEVYPICLPSPEYQLQPGAPLTVSGWGARNETGDFPDTLHEVSVELLPYTPCAESYRNLTGVDIGQSVQHSV